MHAPSAARAFTLVDLMMTVAVMGLCALVATSSWSPSERTRVISAAQLVAGDLEFARELSVSAPADLAVFRIDPGAAGYWVARTSATEKPVARIDGEPFAVTFGSGRHALLLGITLVFKGGATTPPTGGMVTFDAFGRLASGVDAEITVSGAGGAATVAISAATGDVSVR